MLQANQLVAPFMAIAHNRARLTPQLYVNWTSARRWDVRDIVKLIEGLAKRILGTFVRLGGLVLGSLGYKETLVRRTMHLYPRQDDLWDVLWEEQNGSYKYLYPPSTYRT